MAEGFSCLTEGSQIVNGCDIKKNFDGGRGVHISYISMEHHQLKSIASFDLFTVTTQNVSVRFDRIRPIMK